MPKDYDVIVIGGGMGMGMGMGIGNALLFGRIAGTTAAAEALRVNS
jgi:hypothetical protein